MRGGRKLVVDKADSAKKKLASGVSSAKDVVINKTLDARDTLKAAPGAIKDTVAKAPEAAKSFAAATRADANTLGQAAADLKNKVVDTVTRAEKTPATPEEKLRTSLARIELMAATLKGAGAPGLGPLVTGAQTQKTQAACDLALQAEAAAADYSAQRKRAARLLLLRDSEPHGDHGLVAAQYDAMKQAVEASTTAWEAAATPAAAIAAARALISAVDQAGASIRGVGKALAEADKPISKAEVRLDQYTGIGSVDLTAPQKLVSEARKAWTDATTLGQVTASAAKLGDYEAVLKTATQGKAGVKDLGKYRERRKRVMEDVGKAAALPGAQTDPDLVALLANARNWVEQADAALASNNSEALEVATDILVQGKTVYKQAKALSAVYWSAFKDDIKDEPAFRQQLAALENTRARLSGMPGGPELNDAILAVDALLASVRTTQPDGRPALGYVAALASIKGKAAECLAKGQRLSTEYLSGIVTKDPDAAKAYAEAKRQLGAYAENHPPSLVVGRSAEVAAALTAARATGDDRLEPLRQITLSMKAATEDQEKRKTALAAALQALDATIASLRSEGGSAEMLDALGDRTEVDAFESAREYEAAVRRLKVMSSAAEAALQELRVAKTEWPPRDQRMQQILDAAPGFGGWPPLALEMGGIALAARETRKLMASDQPAAAINLADQMWVRFGELKSKMADAGIDPAQLKTAFEPFLKRWDDQNDLLVKATVALGAALKARGVSDGVAATDFLSRSVAIDGEWNSQVKNLSIDDGESAEDGLHRSLDPVIAACKALTDEAVAAEKDPTRLAAWAKSAEPKELARRHDALSSKLRELDSAGVEGLAAEWELVGRTFDPVQTAARAAGWNGLEARLESLLKARHAKILEMRINGKKALGTLDAQLNGRLTRKSDFPGFFDEMTRLSADAQALLDADDPTLVSEGIKLVKKLGGLLAQARGRAPKQDGAAVGAAGSEAGGEATARSFDDVMALLSELSEICGTEMLRKRMPATYGKLYTELGALTQLAKAVPPSASYPKLEQLRPALLEAREAAIAVGLEYKIFKQQRKEVEAMFDEVRALTRTRVTEKTDAYNEKFALRLENAHDLARQEGMLKEAFKQLNALRAELAAILAQTPADARAQLQALDAAAVGEQQQVEELCRHWKARKKYWSDTLLPELKTAIKLRGNKEIDDYEKLEQAVDSTDDTLGPYLDTLSKNPKKMLLSTKTFDLPTVQNAFAAAYLRLTALERTARSMLSNAGSTNVELEENLGKLQDEWRRRVTAARLGLNGVATKIAALPAAAGNDPAKPETFLEPAVKARLAADAQALATMIGGLSDRFSEAAFSAPMAVLVSKVTGQAQRLKARDELLRMNRRLADEIAGNVFIQRLFDPRTKSLLEVDVTRELGLLRACLKKIELATLIAV